MFQVGYFGKIRGLLAGACGGPAGGQGGFTLIEVMVAVLIMSLAYVSILQNFSLSLKNISRIAAKRQDIFQKQLDFEAAVREIDNPDSKTDLQSDVFLEGGSFKLLRLFDEGREFTTLVLAPLN